MKAASVELTLSMRINYEDPWLCWVLFLNREPLQNDQPLVQINVVFVDRWSLFAVHFLYNLTVCARKGGPCMQVVTLLSGRLRQVSLYFNDYIWAIIDKVTTFGK